MLSHDFDNQYIKKGGLPSHFHLREPSKLQAKDVTLLWDYWARQQKKNVRGLEFLKAQTGDMRQRETVTKPPPKAHFVDPDIDDYETDRGEGSSKAQHMKQVQVQPHRDSPAAHNADRQTKYAYLKSLCGLNKYLDLVKALKSHKVFYCYSVLQSFDFLLERHKVLIFQCLCQHGPLGALRMNTFPRHSIPRTLYKN